MAKLGKAATKRRGRAPKTKVIGDFDRMLSHGHGFLLADNLGMTVDAITKLRATMRKNSVGVKVAKNRLFRLALERRGIDTAAFKALLKGPTVVIAGSEDPVTPARLLVEQVKDSKEKLTIKGGFFEGRVLTAAQVDALSKLPSREQLLARLCGSVQSPAQKLVFALNAAVAKVVHVTDAYRRQLAGE